MSIQMLNIQMCIQMHLHLLTSLKPIRGENVLDVVVFTKLISGQCKNT